MLAVDTHVEYFFHDFTVTKIVNNLPAMQETQV